ncbi:hypothetical protein CSUI_009143, partial [Cystoisospora suis]
MQSDTPRAPAAPRFHSQTQAVSTTFQQRRNVLVGWRDSRVTGWSSPAISFVPLPHERTPRLCGECLDGEAESGERAGVDDENFSLRRRPHLGLGETGSLDWNAVEQIHSDCALTKHLVCRPTRREMVQTGLGEASSQQATSTNLSPPLSPVTGGMDGAVEAGSPLRSSAGGVGASFRPLDAEVQPLLARSPHQWVSIEQAAMQLDFHRENEWKRCAAYAFAQQGTCRAKDRQNSAGRQSAGEPADGARRCNVKSFSRCTPNPSSKYLPERASGRAARKIAGKSFGDRHRTRFSLSAAIDFSETEGAPANEADCSDEDRSWAGRQDILLTGAYEEGCKHSCDVDAGAETASSPAEERQKQKISGLSTEIPPCSSGEDDGPVRVQEGCVGKERQSTAEKEAGGPGPQQAQCNSSVVYEVRHVPPSRQGVCSRKNGAGQPVSFFSSASLLHDNGDSADPLLESQVLHRDGGSSDTQTPVTRAEAPERKCNDSNGVYLDSKPQLSEASEKEKPASPTAPDCPPAADNSRESVSGLGNSIQNEAPASSPSRSVRCGSFEQDGGTCTVGIAYLDGGFSGVSAVKDQHDWLVNVIDDAHSDQLGDSERAERTASAVTEEDKLCDHRVQKACDSLGRAGFRGVLSGSHVIAGTLTSPPSGTRTARRTKRGRAHIPELRSHKRDNAPEPQRNLWSERTNHRRATFLRASIIDGELSVERETAKRHNDVSGTVAQAGNQEGLLDVRGPPVSQRSLRDGDSDFGSEEHGLCDSARKKAKVPTACCSGLHSTLSSADQMQVSPQDRLSSQQQILTANADVRRTGTGNRSKRRCDGDRSRESPKHQIEEPLPMGWERLVWVETAEEDQTPSPSINEVTEEITVSTGRGDTHEEDNYAGLCKRPDDSAEMVRDNAPLCKGQTTRDRFLTGNGQRDVMHMAGDELSSSALGRPGGELSRAAVEKLGDELSLVAEEKPGDELAPSLVEEPGDQGSSCIADKPGDEVAPSEEKLRAGLSPSVLEKAASGVSPLEVEEKRQASNEVGAPSEGDRVYSGDHRRPGAKLDLRSMKQKENECPSAPSKPLQPASTPVATGKCSEAAILARSSVRAVEVKRREDSHSIERWRSALYPAAIQAFWLAIAREVTPSIIPPSLVRLSLLLPASRLSFQSAKRRRRCSTLLSVSAKPQKTVSDKATRDTKFCRRGMSSPRSLRSRLKPPARSLLPTPDHLDLLDAPFSKTEGWGRIAGVVPCRPSAGSAGRADEGRSSYEHIAVAPANGLHLSAAPGTAVGDSFNGRPSCSNRTRALSVTTRASGNTASPCIAEKIWCDVEILPTPTTGRETLLENAKPEPPVASSESIPTTTGDDTAGVLTQLTTEERRQQPFKLHTPCGFTSSPVCPEKLQSGRPDSDVRPRATESGGKHPEPAKLPRENAAPSIFGSAQRRFCMLGGPTEEYLASDNEISKSATLSEEAVLPNRHRNDTQAKKDGGTGCRQPEENNKSTQIRGAALPGALPTQSPSRPSCYAVAREELTDWRNVRKESMRGNEEISATRNSAAESRALCGELASPKSRGREGTDAVRLPNGQPNSPTSLNSLDGGSSFPSQLGGVGRHQKEARDIAVRETARGGHGVNIKPHEPHKCTVIRGHLSRPEILDRTTNRSAVRRRNHRPPDYLRLSTSDCAAHCFGVYLRDGVSGALPLVLRLRVSFPFPRTLSLRADGHDHIPYSGQARQVDHIPRGGGASVTLMGCAGIGHCEGTGAAVVESTQQSSPKAKTKSCLQGGSALLHSHPSHQRHGERRFLSPSKQANDEDIRVQSACAASIQETRTAESALADESTAVENLKVENTDQEMPPRAMDAYVAHSRGELERHLHHDPDTAMLPKPAVGLFHREHHAPPLSLHPQEQGPLTSVSCCPPSSTAQNPFPAGGQPPAQHATKPVASGSPSTRRLFGLASGRALTKTITRSSTRSGGGGAKRCSRREDETLALQSRGKGCHERYFGRCPAVLQSAPPLSCLYQRRRPRPRNCVSPFQGRTYLSIELRSRCRELLRERLVDHYLSSREWCLRACNVLGKGGNFCRSDECAGRGTTGHSCSSEAGVSQLVEDAHEETCGDRLMTESLLGSVTAASVGGAKASSGLLAELHSDDKHQQHKRAGEAAAQVREERQTEGTTVHHTPLGETEKHIQSDLPLVRAPILKRKTFAAEPSNCCNIPRCGKAQQRLHAEDRQSAGRRKAGQEKGVDSCTVLVSRSPPRTEMRVPSSFPDFARRTKHLLKGVSSLRTISCSDGPLCISGGEVTERLNTQTHTRRPLLHIRLCTLWISFDLVMPPGYSFADPVEKSGGRLPTAKLPLLKRGIVGLAAVGSCRTPKALREDHHESTNQPGKLSTSQHRHERPSGDTSLPDALQGQPAGKEHQEAGEEKFEAEQSSRDEKMQHSTDSDEATRGTLSVEIPGDQAKGLPNKRCRFFCEGTDQENRSSVVTTLEQSTILWTSPAAGHLNEVGGEVSDNMKSREATLWQRKKLRTMGGHMHDKGGAQATTRGHGSERLPCSLSRGDKEEEARLSETIEYTCKVRPKEEKDGSSEQNRQAPAGEVAQEMGPKTNCAGSPAEDLHAATLDKEAKKDWCTEERGPCQSASAGIYFPPTYESGVMGHQQRSRYDEPRINEEAQCEAEESLRHRRRTENPDSLTEQRNMSSVASPRTCRSARRETQTEEGRREIRQGAAASEARANQAVGLRRWLGQDVISLQLGKPDDFSRVISWGLDWFCSSASQSSWQISQALSQGLRPSSHWSRDGTGANCYVQEGDEEELLSTAVTGEENPALRMSTEECPEEPESVARQQLGAWQNIEVVVTACPYRLRQDFTGDAQQENPSTTVSEVRSHQMRLLRHFDADRISEARSRVSSRICGRIGGCDPVIPWRTMFPSGPRSDSRATLVTAHIPHTLSGEARTGAHTRRASLSTPGAPAGGRAATRREPRPFADYKDIACCGRASAEFIRGVIETTRRRRTLFRYGMETLAKLLMEIEQNPQTAVDADENGKGSATGGQTGISASKHRCEDSQLRTTLPPSLRFPPRESDHSTDGSLFAAFASPCPPEGGPGIPVLAAPCPASVSSHDRSLCHPASKPGRAVLEQQSPEHEDDSRTVVILFSPAPTSPKQSCSEGRGRHSEHTSMNQTRCAFPQLSGHQPGRQETSQTGVLPVMQPVSTVSENMAEGAVHCGGPARSAASVGVYAACRHTDDRSTAVAEPSKSTRPLNNRIDIATKRESTVHALTGGAHLGHAPGGEPEHTSLALGEGTTVCAAQEAQSSLGSRILAGGAEEEAGPSSCGTQDLTPLTAEECRGQDHQESEGRGCRSLSKADGPLRIQISTFQQPGTDGKLQDAEDSWHSQLGLATGRSCDSADGSHVPQQEQIRDSGHMCYSGRATDGQLDCGTRSRTTQQQPRTQRKFAIVREMPYRLTRVQSRAVKQSALPTAANLLAPEVKGSTASTASVIQKGLWGIETSAGHPLPTLSTGGGLFATESEQGMSGAAETAPGYGTSGSDGQRGLGGPARESATGNQSADITGVHGDAERRYEGLPAEAGGCGRLSESSSERYGVGGQPAKSVVATSPDYPGTFQVSSEPKQPGTQKKHKQIEDMVVGSPLDLPDSSCPGTNPESISSPLAGDQERRDNREDKRYTDSATTGPGQPLSDTLALPASPREFASRQGTCQTSAGSHDTCQLRGRQGFDGGEPGDREASRPTQDGLQAAALLNTLVPGNATVDTRVLSGLTDQFLSSGRRTDGGAGSPEATCGASPSEDLFSAVPLQSSNSRPHSHKRSTVLAGIPQVDLSHLTEPEQAGNTGVPGCHQILVAPSPVQRPGAPVSSLSSSGCLWDVSTQPRHVKAASEEDRLQEGCRGSMPEILRPLVQGTLHAAGECSSELEPCLVEEGQAPRQPFQEFRGSQPDNRKTEAHFDCPPLAAEASAVFGAPNRNTGAYPLTVHPAPHQETTAATPKAASNARPGSEYLFRVEEGSAISGVTHSPLEHGEAQNSQGCIHTSLSHKSSQETLVD